MKKKEEKDIHKWSKKYILKSVWEYISLCNPFEYFRGLKEKGFSLSLMVLCGVSFILPYCSAVVFLGRFLVQRTLRTFLEGLGQVLVEVVCRVIKIVHYEPRPAGAQRRDSGFPSSHTAWMAYAAATLSKSGPHRLLKTLTLMPLAFVTGAGRVVSQEHTVRQVIAGGVVGLALAALDSRLAPAQTP